MATLKDVAREAGLTTSTVSRILNNRGYISDKSRQKVYDAMKKLDYYPNEMARALRGKRTNTIGLIVPHIRHPYFAEMISNLEDQASKNGYKILLFNSQSINEKAVEQVNTCVGNRVAGIILCSGTIPVGSFDGAGVPVITMERFLENGTASVECDNRQGGALAAEKLISCGCRHLLHVGNVAGISMPADLRAEGFQEVCERKKVSYRKLVTEKHHYNNMEYEGLLENILREYPKTDGIFVSSDVIGAQTLQICRKLDIKVPEQMKIVGFDDVSLASLTIPQLTTIHQPIEEMAETAIRLMDDCVMGRMVPRRTVLPVWLVERETT